MAKKAINKPVLLDGYMAVSEENNLHILDFVCCEDVQMDAFTGKCKVELMRDGNVYISELPRRHKNKPIFRDDNCSLSHGHNGKFYFVFTMDDDRLDDLPQQLIQQAGNIARKVLKEIIFKKEVLG
jgi:hypothetical protein